MVAVGAAVRKLVRFRGRSRDAVTAQVAVWLRWGTRLTSRTRLEKLLYTGVKEWRHEC